VPSFLAGKEEEAADVWFKEKSSFPVRRREVNGPEKAPALRIKEEGHAEAACNPKTGKGKRKSFSGLRERGGKNDLVSRKKIPRHPAGTKEGKSSLSTRRN